ncbi:oxidoreductase [Penicillium hispanicum]|uniref:oxidoreductase n=1 Tax=Penicillium hispanicum TaxID=1080232 RepID=UPI0025425C8F|nr:oxidoreductase [Penicillium hispanicum]KAJ5573446.1 oxidoreductase [Penicillium hispanicum]
MPSNRAAWQDQAGTALSIRPLAHPTELAPNQLLVHVQAWAINPCDYMLQDIALPFVKYPVILGEDVAGTVVQAGTEAATRFKINDRVLAFAEGAVHGAAQGGFQEYVVVDSKVTCPIPEWMGYAEASVFPLGLHTAAHGLFNREALALPLPTPNSDTTSNKDKCVLIWGGASSVGSNAIQLARAAGLDVLVTASAKNFEYVKKLGASKVFDYNRDDVVVQITSELAGGAACVGILQAAGSNDSIEPCLEISRRAKDDILVITTTPPQEGVVPDGVRAKMIFGFEQEDTRAVWEEFLPRALEKRAFLVAPEPWVMDTKGIDGIQEGFDALRKGVSAKKIVVLAE